MVRFSGVVCAVLLAGFTALAAADTVYKWIDGAGQIHYTDLPPRQSDARILGTYQKEAGTIESDEDGGDGSDENDSFDAPPEQDSASPSTPESLPSEETMAAAQADTAKVQAEQCKSARDRYQKYIEARRLFRETPDGQRVYLTDQELTLARARAKQEVDDYCS